MEINIEKRRETEGERGTQWSKNIKGRWKSRRKGMRIDVDAGDQTLISR